MSGPDVLSTDAVGVLEESRRREKAQTLFYHTLAAGASAAGDEQAVERLNELHADEQLHLSRLTARLLELGRAPLDLSAVAVPAGVLEGWEAEARAREVEEVHWYESPTAARLDDATTAVLREILEAERHHAREFCGKWMSA